MKLLVPKHAVKQVDRLLSNRGVDVWQLFALWVPYLVAEREEIVVALDWTDFDADNQSTLALHLLTSHGRATPLMWKTVLKSGLRGWRNEHEDVLLARLREVVPEKVHVTILADRGFGDQKLYELLGTWGFDFVIRFREGIMVSDAGHEQAGVGVGAQDGAPQAAARGGGHQRSLRRARGGLRQGAAHEGRVVPRLQPRRVHSVGDRQAVRQALYHRGEFPRRQGYPLRHGPLGDAHQLPRAP